MAMMMGELYRALVEGGTSVDTARKASEEIADYQKPLAELRVDLSIIKALLGVVVAGVAALVIRTFFG